VVALAVVMAVVLVEALVLVLAAEALAHQEAVE
ncbi:hypothetical protein MTO96_049943, partial [Rhipicephalus appendiculatus]